MDKAQARTAAERRMPVKSFPEGAGGGAGKRMETFVFGTDSGNNAAAPTSRKPREYAQLPGKKINHAAESKAMAISNNNRNRVLFIFQLSVFS